MTTQSPTPSYSQSSGKQPARFNPWLIRMPLLVFIGSTLLMIALVVLLALFQISIAGRIAPGTSSLGVSIGGLSTVEAETRLVDAFTYANDSVFTFRYGDQFWQFTAGALGVELDASETAQTAYRLTHGSSPIENLVQQTQTWFAGQSVSPVIQFNEAVARQHLADIAREIDQPAQPATLIIDGLEVVTTETHPGVVLDTESALNTLREQLLNLQPGGEIQLTTRTIGAAQVDVESAAAYLRTAISAPLTIVTTDAAGNPLGPWQIQPEQIAAMLKVEQPTNLDGSISYDIQVDMSELTGTLETLAPGLIIPASNGRYTFDEVTGSLETLVPAVNGRRLNIEATIQRLEDAVFNVQDRTVEIAYDYVKPRYHNELTAAELGITEMVSSSRTLFTGSTAARRTNIQRGAELYNGVIIAPGETFSFNEIVGNISEENGFVEGAIIFGGRTVKGIGGGICQVSTTAFRAAFTGGYPIVERYSHGYRVGYYELDGFGPGLDAAIFTPTADLKFTNDTAYHLLIETEFFDDQDALEFRFYSTNPGRTIEVRDPIVRNVTPPTATIYEANENLQPGQQLQVDWSQEGGDVIITRVIRDLQGNILESRDFATFYQPWSAVIQVPPGDPRLS